jgi:NAD(P)-dependent dehydrogenase (short-subunit alcohol dehydrogenase family)
MPQAPQRILITGGAGFIGSHTCLVLLEAGRQLVVLDNFSNSCRESLRRVVELVGGDAADRLTVVEGDIRQADDLERAFNALGALGPIEAVVHFAGLKAVAESVAEPLRYWDVNVGGTVQQQRHRVWHAGADPHCGNVRDPADQSLRAHQGGGGTAAGRPRGQCGAERWSGLAIGAAALLQSGWGPSQRADR